MQSTQAKISQKKDVYQQESKNGLMLPAAGHSTDVTGLQHIANQSSQVSQLVHYQQMADHHTMGKSSTPVIQMQRAYKQVQGITHLVEMTSEGHIYNEDFLQNEHEELSTGDVVLIETNEKYLSRRGPNQEINAAEHKEGPQQYLWYRVLKVNGREIPAGIFIRDGTFAEYSEQENLVGRMEEITQLPEMRWNGSGARGFTEWMNEATDQEPKEANCWNAVLYAAYKAKLVDKAYIRRANEGGMSGSGAALALRIVNDPAGTVVKGDHESHEDFIDRLSAANIPRGSVVVIGPLGQHVLLSQGGGQMLELDKQAPVETPGKEPSAEEAKKLRLLQLQLARSLNTKKEQTAKQALDDYKSEIGMVAATVKRPDNETRQVSFPDDVIHYFRMGFSQVYWGPLPSL